MDQKNNTEKQLIFSENADQILSDILKKYKLDETDDEVFKKLESDQPLFGEIVTDVTRNLFSGSIKEPQLSSLLKDKLNISKESAEALALDIKGQLLPLVKEVEVPPEGIETKVETKKETTEIFPKIEPTELAKETEIKTEDKTSPAKTIKKPLPTAKEPPTQIKQSSGPDTYREPIE
jgi:hypothetical protein